MTCALYVLNPYRTDHSCLSSHFGRKKIIEFWNYRENAYEIDLIESITLFTTYDSKFLILQMRNATDTRKCENMNFVFLVLEYK